MHSERDIRSKRVWDGLIETLSTMPDVVSHLLVEHADSGGSCASCRVPGRSTPHEDFPCRLYALASAAHAVAEKRDRKFRRAV